MQEKILIFEPRGRGYFVKSPLYAMPIIGKVIALSAKYVARSLLKPMDVATTDLYIEKFWRLHFEESYTALYVTGREYLAKDEIYIFMSNHGSWMDIPAMFGAVPMSLRMVSKAGLMKVPIFGHAMANAGFIAVDRTNRSRAIKQLDEAKRRLREGVSIWIAPEGTRARDDVIKPFKKGGFYLAKDLLMPIVPVYIEGASDVMPADGITIKPNKNITVHFCKPVPADLIMAMPLLDVMNKVRTAIIDKQEECLSSKDLL
jgi:1-acyl-sn-glycerol-3-phosphate acyltransferase